MKARLVFDRTAEHAERRKTLFKAMDKSGGGALTLADVDVGLKEVLLPVAAVLDCKQPVRKAFSFVKSARESGADKTPFEQSGTVGAKEFRLFLHCLWLYFELWTMLDFGQGQDQRLSLEIFRAFRPRLADWGVAVGDADAAFASMEGSNSGGVCFPDFAEWAIARHPVLKAAQSRALSPPQAATPTAQAASPRPSASGSGSAGAGVSSSSPSGLGSTPLTGTRRAAPSAAQRLTRSPPATGRLNLGNLRK